MKSWQTLKAVYTLYSDRTQLEIETEDWTVITIPIVSALPSRLNSFFARVDKKKPAILIYFFDYRNLFVFYPRLMKILSWKLQKALNKQPGDVLISSYAVAKNITVPEEVFKEIYFHQPMHYIWPLYKEYIWYMSWWKKYLYKKVTPWLRRRDTRPRHYDLMYANSQSTKTQIQNLYFPDKKVDIRVVNPPIDPQFFHEDVVMSPKNYFFYINRLTKRFKHLDKIIKLCNKYKIPLIIAGDGPDKHELMALAGDTITFVGWVSDVSTKIDLIKNSRGVFNIAHESFGIVTAEALLLWIPIFWLNGGATPELVDKESSVLTPSLEQVELEQSFQEFVDKQFDRQAIQTRARKLLQPWQAFRTEKD